jgi:hypothetical protein
MSGSMRRLHAIGFDPDSGALILSARKGAKQGSFVISVDDALMEQINSARAVEEEAPPPAPSRLSVDSALTPREIQVRLRAGRTVDEVAREAGVSVEWVERFAAPVQAEQAAAVSRAARAILHTPRKGPSDRALEPSVLRNLADRGVIMLEEEWNEAWAARHLIDTDWMISFRFRNRGRAMVAEWMLNMANGALTSHNRLGTELGFIEPGRRSAVSPLPPSDVEALPPVPVRRTRRSTGVRAAAKPRTGTGKALAKKALAKKVAARRAPAQKVPAKKAPAKVAAKLTGKRATAVRATPRKVATKKKAVARPAPAPTAAAVKKRAAKASSLERVATKRVPAKAAAAKKPEAVKAVAPKRAGTKKAVAPKKRAPRQAGPGTERRVERPARGSNGATARPGPRFSSASPAADLLRAAEAELATWPPPREPLRAGGRAPTPSETPPAKSAPRAAPRPAPPAPSHPAPAEPTPPAGTARIDELAATRTVPISSANLSTGNGTPLRRADRPLRANRIDRSLIRSHPPEPDLGAPVGKPAGGSPLGSEV